MKYHLIENENKELLKLSLRLRTFSSHATLMYAKGTDYSILEVGLSLESLFPRMLSSISESGVRRARSPEHVRPSVVARNSGGFERSKRFA